MGRPSPHIIPTRNGEESMAARKETTLVSKDGREYRTANRNEITRLQALGYKHKKAAAPAPKPKAENSKK